jgi:hypothetical protein
MLLSIVSFTYGSLLMVRAQRSASYLWNALRRLLRLEFFLLIRVPLMPKIANDRLFVDEFLGVNGFVQQIKVSCIA